MRRFGVTQDHVASFLHVDFITEGRGTDRTVHSGRYAPFGTVWSVPDEAGMGSPCFWRLCKYSSIASRMFA